MTCREAELLLNARLDDELDMAGCAGVDRHIDECRACAAQYLALRNLHEEIAAAQLVYPVPHAFETKLARRFFKERPFASWTRSWWIAVAAACAALLLFVVPSTIRRGDILATEILDSHLRALQLQRLVDVPSSDQHTVKPWFQGKTAFSPAVPDLSSEGFALTGGRLEILRQQPAAAIVYRRRQHVISLYVVPGEGADTKPESINLSGYHLLYWTRDNLGYWAVSDLGTSELQRFADLLRKSR
ncbi:MAG: anti-sigma factor [Bryobacteraceae bacterium]